MPADDIRERAVDVFAPDVLVPIQYFDRIRRRKDFTGEQRLMVAVVDLAIDDYMKYAAATERMGKGLFAVAERWIESTDRSLLYSFETICDHLGLNADYVRHGLRRWKARVRGELPSAFPAADVALPAARRRASNE